MVRAGGAHLTIQDLSDRLGISVGTLYRWRSENHDMPKAFKVGSFVRWTEASVDEWVARQEREEAS